MSALWPWVALAGLGVFHGLNPAMGWLFAVARGMQRQSRQIVLTSMLPIAAGHALSVAAVVLAVGLLRAFVNITVLQLSAACLLIGFGAFRLLARHRGRAGMQVGVWQLVLWSFVMASAHGAGLMLLPVLLGMPLAGTQGEHLHAHHMAATGDFTGAAFLAMAVHTAAMLASGAAVAVVVYEWVGLAFLRRGWVNLDLIWVVALIGAGVILLVMTLT